VSTASSVNPTVRRRRLGAELRRLREQRGLTAEEVAQQLLVSQSKISRLENGRRSISQRDVRDLCEVYGVNDQSMIDGLMTMAKESRQRGWWHAFGDVPYSVYIGLEAEAVGIRTYESLFIPGLLQTRDYAHAVVSGIQPEAQPGQIDKRTDVRMVRQELLRNSDEPLRLWAVIDEAALHRVVGSPETMRAQLEHLIEASTLPHVTVQVLPFGIGAHPGMTANFSILEYRDASDATVVYLEGVTSDLYLEKETDVRAYASLYQHLQAQALGPEQTRELVDKVAKHLAQ
jgi:transcriptional regulator with XRE-family HTH domain